MQNFSKNLAASSKILAQERWHSASSILRSHKYKARPDALDLCTPTLMYCRPINYARTSTKTDIVKGVSSEECFLQEKVNRQISLPTTEDLDLPFTSLPFTSQPFHSHPNPSHPFPTATHPFSYAYTCIFGWATVNLLEGCVGKNANSKRVKNSEQRRSITTTLVVVYNVLQHFSTFIDIHYQALQKYRTAYTHCHKISRDLELNLTLLCELQWPKLK